MKRMTKELKQEMKPGRSKAASPFQPGQCVKEERLGPFSFFFLGSGRGSGLNFWPGESLKVNGWQQRLSPCRVGGSSAMGKATWLVLLALLSQALVSSGWISCTQTATVFARQIQGNTRNATTQLYVYDGRYLCTCSSSLREKGWQVGIYEADCWSLY